MCAEDGRVWMAITAHQSKFQRVTKLLKVLHMIDLQFSPWCLPEESGWGRNILCLHRHHHYTINYKPFFTGGDFSKFMKLIKTYIWNAEAFQSVQRTYLLYCVLTATQAKYSITIWSHWNNRNKTKSVSVFIWNSKSFSLWLLCCRPA